MEDLCFEPNIIELFTENKDPIPVSEALLEEFLKNTEHIDLSDAEKIRRLGISLEHKTFENGWEGLSQIYEFAHKIAPQEIDILTSWVISANWYYTGITELPKSRCIEIADKCEAILKKALTISSENDDLHHVFGNLYYDYPAQEEELPKFTQLALHHYQKAVQLNSQNPMAQLYIAHCYHDLKEWDKACQAYQAVDTELLLAEYPYSDWRIAISKQQIAHCCMHLGKLDEAKQWLNDFFDAAENNDEILGFRFDDAEMVVKKLKDKELDKRFQQLLQSQSDYFE